MIAFLKENLRTIGWLILTGFLLTLVIGWGRFELRSFLLIGSLSAFIWVFLWMGNAYLSLWLDKKISWHKDAGKRFLAGVAGMIVYSLSAVYFIAYFYRIVFNFDVGNDIGGTLLSTVIITIIISMFMTSRSFLIHWKQAAVDAEASKKESIRAQYESLRNQVNPHFLFNSLNALTNLVYEDQDKAAKFIKQLSEVYRYVLDTRDKEVVPLQEELRFIEAYLFLQQMRFGNKLRVNLKLEGVETAVAPLAVQMLLENAIKHNVISEEMPLNIDVHADGLFIAVENGLQKKSVLEEPSQGLGLDNIRRRYEFLTGTRVEVYENGEKFIVRLPFLPIPA